MLLRLASAVTKKKAGKNISLMKEHMSWRVLVFLFAADEERTYWCCEAGGKGEHPRAVVTVRISSRVDKEGDKRQCKLGGKHLE